MTKAKLEKDFHNFLQNNSSMEVIKDEKELALV